MTERVTTDTAPPAELAPARDGYELWLDYRLVRHAGRLASYRAHLQGSAVPGNSPTLAAVRAELQQGLAGLLDRPVDVGQGQLRGAGLLAGTMSTSDRIAALGWDEQIAAQGPEGYLIRSVTLDGAPAVVIAAQSEVGVLYGGFHLLRLLQTQQSLARLDVAERPKVQLRLLDHWDNLDGSIERGYAGKSLWKWEELPGTLDPRHRDYARACASIGINGAVLNNVSANPRILRADYLEKVAALADVLRPYGVKVYFSVNFASPLRPSDVPDRFGRWGGIGNLYTADPLDPDVERWWKEKADEIYHHIPDFGGFLVKANSEGMPGPSDYGRTHAEGANMLARALAPHGGIVMWRAFVYDPHVDPDRVKRAYQEFVPLDGEFESNVFVQVKNGPLDFQPREPFHPLFGAMPRTPLMMEFQITQEYLGQAIHLVYLAPMWREVLDSDTFAQGEGSTVAGVIDGSLHGYPMTGIAGVANVGSDRNWCGHHFAQANWYAFGRLAWNHQLSSEAIAEEWIRATFTNDGGAVTAILDMMMGSWEACVNYMTPLGLHHIMREGHHYGPALDYDAEREDWNPQYFHRADAAGLGFDRSSGGSNAVAQYHPPLRDLFDDADCPEEYLLWFHHVPWDYEMRSGRTLWDELAWRYTHGVEYVNRMLETWVELKPHIDPQRHEEVLKRLSTQEAHAIEWPQVCLSYFQGFSRRPIPVNVPGGAIHEAEAATLEPPGMRTLRVRARSPGERDNTHTGGGFVDFDGGPGAVTWAVSAPTATAVQARIRYRHGADTPQVLRLNVNGAERELAFPPCGGAGVWQDLTVAVNLMAGKNVVVLRADRGSAIHIDHIRVPGTLHSADTGEEYSAQTSEGAGS
jgi:alpha-glucuronidase